MHTVTHFVAVVKQNLLQSDMFCVSLDYAVIQIVLLGAIMTNAIASERKRKGLTQTSLGNMIGKDRSTIGRWESNPRVADCGDLEKLADIFDCSVDYLLGRTDERTPSMRKAG